MVVKWLRESTIAAGILTLIRLFIGYSWLTAGYKKLTGDFDASGFIQMPLLIQSWVLMEILFIAGMDHF